MRLLRIIGILSIWTAPVFALFGVGGQWSPNFAAKLDGKTEVFLPEGAALSDAHLSLVRGSATGLQGGGIKLWIDVLPFIDIEASSNLQFTRYNVSVKTENIPSIDTSFALEIDPGLPFFDKATPVFGKLISDVTILYPFLKIPPVIKVLKIYAGGGLTHVYASPVLNAELVREAATKANVSDPNDFTGGNAAKAAIELTKSVADVIAEKGPENGVGGHLVLGARLKPPILPVAVFANAKYHFGGGLPSEVSSGFMFELGAGLAF